MEKLNWMDYKTNSNPILDSYRSLQTNLQNLTAEKKGNVLIVTSVVQNAKKSAIVAGLAIVLAQSGSKTLVIDGNRITTAQHELFAITNKGIADAIATGTDVESYVQPCAEQENLYILPIGSDVQNVEEFLLGKTMKEFIEVNRTCYDYILVDVAAVGSNADAVSFVSKADGVLLVVNKGEDHLNELLEARSKLEQAGGKILGCILNKVNITI